MRTVRVWLLACSVVVSLVPGTLPSGPLPNAAGGEKAQIYSDDAKGLQRQFEPFLKALGNNDDEAKLKESFGVFALPSPETWFAQYFEKDQVQQLVWDEESEVDGYRDTLTRLLTRFLKGRSYSVHCEIHKGDATTLQQRADAISPLTQVPVEQYNVKFSGQDGRSMEQLVNLAYVDGAFRYLGKGSYPFWSMPDATRKPAQ